jgi:hypothetical protein
MKQIAPFIILVCSLSAQASGIDPDCLKSFAVKNKSFSMENETVSCQLIEQSRASVYSRIEAFSGTNSEDIVAAVDALNSMKMKLAEAEKSGDWSFATSVVIGNFIGSAGLISCAETAGLGCALGVAGFTWAKYETIRSVADLDEKKRASVALRGQIDRLNALIDKQRKDVNAKNEAIDSFNNMCAIVKKNCL